MVRYSKIISLSLLGILSLSLLSSCKDDEPLVPEERTFSAVDQRLWRLFEAFEEEGAKRGFDIDLVRAGITGDIVPIPDNHVAGQCSYGGGDPARVTVDSEFWSNSNGNFQEFIVFHELGHCYLHRAHREDADELGFCKSIMRSGLEDCKDNYNLLTRERFIDELFNPEDF